MNEDHPVIQTQNLTYRYGDLTAVSDLNLEVQRGEIFGFLGPNGAGKTTTIRTLINFQFPSEGTVRIFGLDSRQDSLAIRRRVGYLPSELTLWENWRGTQYIEWLEKVHQKPLMEEAQRLAGLLDYDLKRSLKGLSTGMRRKMGLIASMAHQPELYIMDEPTVGLDPLMQQVFNGLMHEIRESGRTVFLSSHNLQEVEAICDRVGIIRDGQLVTTQRVEEMVAQRVSRINMTFADLPPADTFKFEGVTELSRSDRSVMLEVQDNLPQVLAAAAENNIQDIETMNVSLEEIFLTYYGKGNGGNHA